MYTDFARMLREVKPDCAIITTTDRYHNDYVVQALDMGVEVICEKPLTIDEVKLNQILDARERTGKNVRVTFNCRICLILKRSRSCWQKGQEDRFTASTLNGCWTACMAQTIFGDGIADRKQRRASGT